jgi:hypothetical protein
MSASEYCHEACLAARLLAGRAGRSDPRGLLTCRAAVTSAQHHAGPPANLPDIGRLWLPSRANHHEHAASTAASERARTLDCWEPVGHVIADSLGMANSGT